MGELILLLLSAERVLGTHPVISQGEDRSDDRAYNITMMYDPGTLLCYARRSPVRRNYIEFKCVAVRPGTNQVYYYTMQLLEKGT